jgi:thioesterase domain-containing protein
MEQLAARLRKTIVALQPDGPYRLAGWSFGGILAYEIAVQLIGWDEDVEFLGLIDATLPTAATAARLARSCNATPGARLLDLIKMGLGPDRSGNTRCKELRHLFDFNGHDDRVHKLDALDILDQRPDTISFDEILSKCRYAGLLPAALSDTSSLQIRQLLERWAVHDHAIAHYSPFPVSVPVHLFEPQYPLAERAASHDRLNGWETVLQKGEIHFVQVRARHTSMMNGFGSTLGHAVKRALGAASRAVTCGAFERKPLTPEANYRPDVPIQRGAPHREPVVFIPGAGDNVATFVPFAYALDPTWPAHGLQPRGMDGVLVPHTGVEAAARMYLPTIEKLAAVVRGNSVSAPGDRQGVKSGSL